MSMTIKMGAHRIHRKHRKKVLFMNHKEMFVGR